MLLATDSGMFHLRMTPEQETTILDKIDINAELRDVSQRLFTPKREIFLFTDGSHQNLTTDTYPPGSNIFIQKARLRVFENWAESQEKYQTSKARLVSLLDLFPEDMRIKQTIIPIKDRDGLRVEMERLVREGKEVGLRTCYGKSTQNGHRLGINPWIMGITTIEQIRAFFGEAPLDQAKPWRETKEKDQEKHQTYQRWVEEEIAKGLKEIIVMENPKGLSTERPTNNFVFRLDAFGKQTPFIELRDSTNQLRSLDGQMPRSSQIHIGMKIPKNYYGIYGIGEIAVKIGKKYLRKESLTKDIIEQFEEGWVEWDSENPNLQRIKPETKELIDQIVNFIFFNSFNRQPQRLYHLLSALSLLGIDDVEFQGKHDKKGNIEWAKVYGLRGHIEVDHLFPLWNAS